MQINISLNHASTKPGEEVYIAGSLPQFGEWIVSESKKNQTNSDLFDNFQSQKATKMKTTGNLYPCWRLHLNDQQQSEIKSTQDQLENLNLGMVGEGRHVGLITIENEEFDQYRDKKFEYKYFIQNKVSIIKSRTTCFQIIQRFEPKRNFIFVFVHKLHKDFGIFYAINMFSIQVGHCFWEHGNSNRKVNFNEILNLVEILNKTQIIGNQYS